jgi:type II secretory pathway component GspD/PulD (secretin)
MKTISVVLVWMVSMISGVAFADSFDAKCPDLAACAKAVGELTGQKYVFDGDLKGRSYATPNVEFTKENAELLFTTALDRGGFARVPLGPPGTYMIARQRDARDLAIPLVSADATTAPVLPETWDLLTLKYKATNPDVVEQIARTARSFMPANSRIIANELSGFLWVTDTAPNLKKIYELIRTSDIKPTAEMKRKWDEKDKQYQLERLEKVKSEGHNANDGPKPAPH